MSPSEILVQHSSERVPHPDASVLVMFLFLTANVRVIGFFRSYLTV